MSSPRKGKQNPVYRPCYRHVLGRLVKARKAAGLTQAEAADALGIPRSKVSRSETGERRIDPVDLAEFAILYGKDVAYFLPSEGQLLKENRELRNTPYRKIQP